MQIPLNGLNYLILRNAIARSELAYQRRSSRAPRRWWHRLSRGLLFITLTLAIVLFLGAVTGLLIHHEGEPLDDWLLAITYVLGFVVVVFHFVTMFRTLMLSTNSLIRETHNQTWEMLVLTGIDSQQIARGKWWGTVANMWWQYALLGLLAASMTIWFGAYTNRELADFINRNYGSSSLQIYVPSAFQMMLGGVIVFVLTMANLPFTAACGVLAAAQVRQNAWALGRAVGIRVIVLISLTFGASLLPALFRLWIYPSVSEVVWRAVSGLYFDGALLGAELSRVTYYMGDDPHLNPYLLIVIGSLLSLAIYGGATWLILRMAQQGLVNELALPPKKLPRKRYRFQLEKP